METSGIEYRTIVRGIQQQLAGGKRMAALLPWQTFDTPLLRDLALAFSRRSKAIRYKTESFDCQREVEESPEGARERLNIDTVGIASPAQLRLSVWSDGVLWFRACTRAVGTNAGWAYLEACYGNIRSMAPAEVVSAYEAAMDLCHEPVPADLGLQIRLLWNASEAAD
jgi:hypothetical protein